MRKFLYLACAALGALATSLALALPASASAHAGKPDATAVCGSKCFDLSSLQLGLRYIQNKSNTQAGRIGLRLASNTFTNEDFEDQAIGSVSAYCTPVPDAQQFNSTGYICTHYGSDPVFEANFAPDSNQSGNCVGVSAANTPGANAKMQPCGQTTRTLWIADLAEGTVHHGHLYVPWIQGSDTNFSHPLVLTLNLGTKNPADGLQVERANLTGGSLPLTQEFTVVAGPAA